jgi:hypothetical protein
MIPFLKSILQSFAWFVVVAPWEQAIRVRMGKHVRLLEAGFYLRIPFVDRVFKQSIRRRLSIVRPQTLTTRDNKVVTLSGALGYAIKDLRRLYDTLESAHDTIENEVAAVVARYVCTHEYSECTPARVAEAVTAELKLERYGLDGQSFEVTSFLSAKTYRLVMGDLPSWQNDGCLKMEESQQAR